MMYGAHANVADAIGNTPIVKLNRLSEGLKANIYCKLGYMNPGGSVKDRIALNIINEAERRGDLKPGGTIVEATSGNTGMGLAMMGNAQGHRLTTPLSKHIPAEKRIMLRVFGTHVEELEDKL